MAGSGSSSSAGVFRTFDNTDPGIEYSQGDWLDDRGIAGVFNNTLAETTTQGATVHIEFTGASPSLWFQAVAYESMLSGSLPNCDHRRDRRPYRCKP